jgi:hypothetical protein
VAGAEDAGGAGGAGGAKPPLGAALFLDGVDDYAEVPNTDAFTPVAGFSWALWFRGTALPTSTGFGRAQTLIGASDTQLCEDIYLGFGSDVTAERDLVFVLDGNGDCGGRDNQPVTYFPPDGFENGRYYHVVAVADYLGQVSRLYLDGEQVRTTSRDVSPRNRSVVINIGRWFDGSNTFGYFSGAIDELRVYGRVLGPEEVTALYADGVGTYGDAADPYVIAGWHFDEGEGDVASAYVGMSHATLVNGATWAEGLVQLP